MRYLFFFLLAFTVSGISFGQSNPLDKKLQKAQALFSNGKYDEAGKYLEDLLKDHPGFGDGWDLLSQVRYVEYEKSKTLGGFFDNVKISTEDENGKKIENDSLTRELASLLSAASPDKIAYNKLINTLRRATLLAPEAYTSAIILRILEVDKEIDTNVNKKALGYYKEAQHEFSEKNYHKAALLYKRAVEAQPDFYKANLYLGDCFYVTDNFHEAAKSFKEAMDKFPDQLEPRKYLIDAYIKLEMTDKVIEECINSFCVYPERGMLERLEDALYLKHQRLDVKPITRKVFPNRPPSDEKLKLTDESEELVPDEMWKSYQQSYETVSKYYNRKGLLTEANSVTTSPYLEVYCWEEMLKKSNDSMLEQARRMQKAGYLDCYVLVTNFHYDLYDQYLKFIGSNKDKVKKYYEMIIKHN